MAKISIQRKKEYQNMLRNYQIFIDGHLVGTIANGELKEFQTTEGPHMVTAKIDWCSSPDFTVTLENGETKNLLVGNYKKTRWLMPVALGIAIIQFIVSLTLGIYYFILAGIPIFALQFYHLTFGRKKYLELMETPLIEESQEKDSTISIA